ncbi:MAG TPA: polysaccharide pyruvyl transferase family protein [Devosiaceae bacterium]|nr:polysaccharide pyruvyl transferase family protein [Devosiaceae bacterium]
MELVYFRDPKLNFGDDLNAHIWDHVLSPEFRARDDIIFVGIGSILTAERLEQYVGSPKHVIVGGSGVSYGTPPSDMSRWYFAAVRGPLSAAVLGRPEAAITDSAILLARTQGLVSRSPEPKKILFVPHRSSLKRTDWEAICRKAGLEFLSPQTPVTEVLSQFGEARLVVTEAMHGAILADTLRIPWVPVVINPEIDEFKWRDWARSMEVPYRPISLRAVVPDDLYGNWIVRRNLKRAGIGSHTLLEAAQDANQYQQYLERRFGPPAGSFAKQSMMDTRLWRLLRRPLWKLQPFFIDAAVRALRAAAASQPFLSEDRVFDERLEQMSAAIERMEAHFSRQSTRLATT